MLRSFAHEWGRVCGTLYLPWGGSYTVDGGNTGCCRLGFWFLEGLNSQTDFPKHEPLGAFPGPVPRCESKNPVPTGIPKHPFALGKIRQRVKTNTDSPAPMFSPIHESPPQYTVSTLKNQTTWETTIPIKNLRRTPWILQTIPIKNPQKTPWILHARAAMLPLVSSCEPAFQVAASTSEPLPRSWSFPRRILP